MGVIVRQQSLWGIIDPWFMYLLNRKIRLLDKGYVILGEVSVRVLRVDVSFSSGVGSDACLG
jgi:hypothetical protein